MNAKDRKVLRGEAQRLKPMFVVGKEGLSPKFAKAMEELFLKEPLIKIKILGDRDYVRSIAEKVETETQSLLVSIVGKSAAFYKKIERSNATDSDIVI